MRALLRADWFRLRRRKDLWIMVIGVGLVAAFGFISGYRSDVADPPPFDQAQFEQMLDSGGFTIDGVAPGDLAQMRQQMIDEARASSQQQLADRNLQQLTDLQKYVFPQSIATVIGLGIVPVIVLILMMSILLGDEFRFGTIRTSLLAAGDRRRFLATRLLLFAILAGAVYLGLVGLATVLSLGLVVTGAELAPATIGLDIGSTAALIAAELGVLLVGLVLAALVTVVTRNALSFLLIGIGIGIEVAITALPVFLPGQPLDLARQVFLTSEVRLLLSRLAAASHAISLSSATPPGPTDSIGPAFEIAVIVAWGVLFVVLADRRIRRMDVVE